MAFKTILLPIRESDTAGALIETGIGMALRNQGHLDLLFVQSEPSDLLKLTSLGLSQSMRSSIIESAGAATESQIVELRQAFESLCQKYSLPIQQRGTNPQQASANFLTVTGQRDDLIGKYGRLADLIIVPQPVKTSPPPSSFEAALRNTGRPVLMVQRNTVLEAPGKTLAIGWNSSKEAAQAISSMRANLSRADKVYVLTSEERMKEQMNADDVCTYLMCQGITAETATFNTARQSVGEALLQTSIELDCDRLIVGGYSRPKLKDVIMGGVTGHLLAKATIPVIFVH